VDRASCGLLEDHLVAWEKFLFISLACSILRCGSFRTLLVPYGEYTLLSALVARCISSLAIDSSFVAAY